MRQLDLETTDGRGGMLRSGWSGFPAGPGPTAAAEVTAPLPGLLAGLTDARAASEHLADVVRAIRATPGREEGALWLQCIATPPNGWAGAGSESGGRSGHPADDRSLRRSYDYFGQLEGAIAELRRREAARSTPEPAG